MMMNQIIEESSRELVLSEERHNVYLTVLAANGERLQLLGDIVPCKTGDNGTVVICQEASHHPSMSVSFLLDNMQAAVFGMDTSMNCVLWNQAMQKLTGIPEEHVFGKSILHEVVSSRSNGLLHVQQQPALLQLEVAMLQVQVSANETHDAIHLSPISQPAFADPTVQRGEL
jgi:PAS domain-containing protein